MEHDRNQTASTRLSTKRELIALLTGAISFRDISPSVVAWRLVGNVLWVVEETMVGYRLSRLLQCYVMLRDGRDWGYQVRSEKNHPWYDSCPLSLLDMTEETNPAWRQRVRQFHQ